MLICFRIRMHNEMYVSDRSLYREQYIFVCESPSFAENVKLQKWFLAPEIYIYFISVYY